MDVGPPSRVQFAEPPLAEFVLEFQFASGQDDQSPEQPGLERDGGADRGLLRESSPAPHTTDADVRFRAFHAAVRDYFPVAERIETANLTLDVQLSADALRAGGEGEIGSSGAVPSSEALRDALDEALRAARRSSALHRFGRTDRGMVVTVGPDLLGLSVLPPQLEGGYPGWEAVRDVALRLLQLHHSLWNAGVPQHVGLRYINVIPVAPIAFRLGDYVQAAPGLVPPRLLDERNPFTLEVTHAISVTGDAAHEQSISLAAGPAASALGGELVLSIDERFIGLSDAALDALGDTEAVCNILHVAASQVFGELLAPDVRGTFKPKLHKELAPT